MCKPQCATLYAQSTSLLRVPLRLHDFFYCNENYIFLCQNFKIQLEDFI